MNISSLIRSMRLRTLPLSLSGTLCGAFLSFNPRSNIADSSFNWILLILLVLTTILLQIISNMANEVGDFRSGVDGNDRQGMQYSLLSGTLSERQLLRAIRCSIVLCMFSGLAMIVVAFHNLLSFQSLLFVLLGIAAIWAALHYTLGRNPYGYRGWGDLFVLLFFGLVAVCGAFFVMANRWNYAILWPALGIGCFSVAVLNVNNIRDMKTDSGHRVTLPLRLGLKAARIYHSSLIFLGWLCLILSSHSDIGHNGFNLWFLSSLPLFVGHLYGVWTREGRRLDPCLPQLVLSVFLTALLFSIPNAIP